MKLQTPNILGVIFGIAQMVLYAIYKDKKKKVLPESMNTKLQSKIELPTVIDIGEAVESPAQAPAPAPAPEVSSTPDINIPVESSNSKPDDKV